VRGGRNIRKAGWFRGRCSCEVAGCGRLSSFDPCRRGNSGNLLAAATLFTLTLTCSHAADQLAAADLADLSLEQLANIEVTSVSRRAERLSGAAASIYVITNDDIRRSGVSSLPEALRLAPNLQVARTSASGYAISARGFNNSIGNKLLVLIDGRTVYTPLFSGVFWDSQDVMLEDIERIEVISGPGGTLWGANAVNGVINIITRQAQVTQGTLVAAGGGNLEAGGSVRHGGKFGADGHYRIYGKYFDRDNTQRANGTDVPDAWHNGQVGFRADWGGSNRNFTFQGDAYSGKLETLPSKTRIDGVNLLGRWNQRLAGGSDFRLQTYFDHIERDIPNAFKEVLNIFDIEFQHGMPIGASQRVLWGGGYRYARDRVENSAALAFLPADKNLDWANLFVQDEIKITDTVELTAGIKLESNDYTGWETLPSLRLAWKPQATQLLWTALSRAVRAPARLDRELFAPASPPFLLAGGPNFRSEIANVFEIGNRGQPSSAISYSITAFYQDYDHLRSLEPAPGATCVALAPGNTCVLGNLIEGTSKGIEAWGSYQAMREWRLSAGVLLLDVDLKPKPGSVDANPAALGNDPDYQWLLRSSHNLTDKLDLDIMLRSIGELPSPNVPSYTAVDLRLGWRPIRDVELSLTLQNLLDDSHPEFGSATGVNPRSVYERGVFLKLMWRM
jgi:iron complex outermembrane recepter protein